MNQLNELLTLDWQIMKEHKKISQKILENNDVYYTQAPLLHAMKILGECSQAELANYLAISPASVAVSLNRLSKLELISRKANIKDLRYNTVSLTQKGMEQATIAAETLVKINLQKFNDFSNEEINDFINYNKRILKNLQKFNEERITI